MTLRTGLPICNYHITKQVLDTFISMANDKLKSTTMIVIYYNIGLSKAGEVEQLGAYTSTGEVFSAFIRTSSRANTSPVLRQIPPIIYSALASEPKDVYERFVKWLRMQNSMCTGSLDDSNIILAAHYGSCYNHVYLVRSIMTWGMDPPNFILSDTLVVFKCIKGMNERASLPILVTKYAPWIEHKPYNAVSDANTLKCVTKVAFPNDVLALLTFSISCQDYMKRVGLNIYRPSPMFPFPTNIESDNEMASSRTNDDSNSSISASTT